MDNYSYKKQYERLVDAMCHVHDALNKLEACQRYEDTFAADPGDEYEKLVKDATELFEQLMFHTSAVDTMVKLHGQG